MQSYEATIDGVRWNVIRDRSMLNGYERNSLTVFRGETLVACNDERSIEQYREVGKVIAYVQNVREGKKLAEKEGR